MAFYISGPKLLFETTEISTHPNSTQQESNYIYLYTTKFGISIKIWLKRKFESTEFETMRVNCTSINTVIIMPNIIYVVMSHYIKPLFSLSNCCVVFILFFCSFSPTNRTHSVLYHYKCCQKNLVFFYSVNLADMIYSPKNVRERGKIDFCCPQLFFKTLIPILENIYEKII
jgi:hypothetical protein